MQETLAQYLGREDPLEKEMATHSSILAWKIPWTEEPGGLWPMVSQKSRTRAEHKHAVPAEVTLIKVVGIGSRVWVILAMETYSTLNK